MTTINNVGAMCVHARLAIYKKKKEKKERMRIVNLMKNEKKRKKRRKRKMNRQIGRCNERTVVDFRSYNTFN